MPTLITRRSALRRVRPLEIRAGGVLGIGEEHCLIPVVTSVEVGEGRVTIESGRRERILRGMGFRVN